MSINIIYTNICFNYLFQLFVSTICCNYSSVIYTNICFNYCHYLFQLFVPTICCNYLFQLFVVTICSTICSNYLFQLFTQKWVSILFIQTNVTTICSNYCQPGVPTCVPPICSNYLYKQMSQYTHHSFLDLSLISWFVTHFLICHSFLRSIYIPL